MLARLFRTPSKRSTPRTRRVRLSVEGLADRIVPSQLPPVAMDDFYSVAHSQTLNTSWSDPGPLSVLANDSDPNGDPLSIVDWSYPANGYLDLNWDGTFSYTPYASFVGQDSFTYTLYNGYGYATATVSITVTNQAPTGNPDSYSVSAGSSLSVSAPGVLVNDSDPDGDPLSAEINSYPANGYLDLNWDGSFSYSPYMGFAGTDTFTYRVFDGAAYSDPVTVTIEVTNQAPVGNPDSYSVSAGSSLSVSAPGVLANDTDPDGDPLSAEIYTYPANGYLDLNWDGSFSYSPYMGFAGTDSFTYRAFDGTAYSNPVTVTIQVINQAPIGNPDTYSVVTFGQIVVAAPGVLANDTDPDGDPLSAYIHTMPANGMVEFNEDGSFHYWAAPGFTGSDTFTYVIYDGTSYSDPVTVTLNVNLSAAEVAAGPAEEGMAFNEVLASITSTLANPVVGDFTVDIDWGDGNNGFGDVVAAGANTFDVRGTHVYADDGQYEVRLVVTDRDGNTTDVVTWITVLNLSPVVDAGPDQTVNEGDLVTVSGSFTDPGIHDTHTYWWEVSSTNGEFFSGQGMTFSFTPSDDGIYTVTFFVSDNGGATGMDSLTVTVLNVAPTVSIGGPTEIDEGVAYVLTLTAAGDPGDDTIMQWTIDWGDGASPEYVDGNPESVLYVYSAPGTYTIQAWATDEDGTYPSGNTITVTVHNVAPVLEMELTMEGQRFVVLSGRVIDPSPGGLTVTFSGQVTGSTVTDSDGFFWYYTEAAGLGQISASVVDGGGLTSNTVQVTVSCPPPQFVDFYAVAEGGDCWTIHGKVNHPYVAGMTVRLSGMGSLDGVEVTIMDSGIFWYTWELAHPDEWGVVTGVVTDWWGQEDSAHCMVSPSYQ